MFSGLLELALEIGERNVDIAHGHHWLRVAEQLHQDGETDAGAKHFRCVGVPELVWNDACGQVEFMADQMQVIAQLTNQCIFTFGACQQKPVSGQRVEGAKESQPLNEGSAEASTGTMRSVLSLPSGT